MLDPKEVEQSVQLTIYTFAYEKLYQRPSKALKVIGFVKTKKPKLMILETTRDATSYQRLYGVASQVLRGINLKIFFPRTGFWCKDCEYGENCKAWKGN
jgi:hypothetical protein